ncbi:group III truncated hemoglobin [Maricaulis sp.]|uniref:group III truncated hemoglobin n=1 Tax=Maricaulis sp. TaxID=1486257 RepID=UPI003A8EAA22
MSTPNPIRATEAREAARSAASAMGIDAALISRLVDGFYAHVRADAVLGPIFDGEIGDGWDEHLAKLKRFWSSIMLHDGSYSGRPMPAHMKLTGLTPQHFETWLALFEQTLGEIGASEAAQAHFMDRAHRIAQSFQLNIFYNPKQG